MKGIGFNRPLLVFTFLWGWYNTGGIVYAQEPQLLGKVEEEKLYFDAMMAVKKSQETRRQVVQNVVVKRDLASNDLEQNRLVKEFEDYIFSQKLGKGEWFSSIDTIICNDAALRREFCGDGNTDY